MAVRAQRNTGLIVTLVIFVFLTLVGMVLAIMFYSKLTEAQVAERGAREELNKIRLGADNIAAIEAAEAEAAREAGRTAVGPVAHLVATRNRVTAALTGAENLTLKQVEDRMKAAGITEGENALTHIEALTAERDAEKKRADDLNARIEELSKQVQGLNETKTRIEATADEQKQKLVGDLQAIKDEVDKLKQTQEERLTALATSIETKEGERDKKLQTAEDEIQRLTTLSTDLGAKVKQLQGGRDTAMPTAPEPIRDVDGTIVAIPPSRNIVHISLGRQDHMVAGMTFEVFDAERGVEVVVDEKDEKTFRASKATIEVVNLFPTSAACRVVRTTPGKPIRIGDLIANLVYDKDRTFKFYVFGDFNLDNIGEASLSDREMVIDLIERWGGQVIKPEERQQRLKALRGEGAAEENLLPYDTDFLIVGAEPVAPEVPDDPQPADIARQNQYKAELDLYNRLHKEATELGIPILNQNRFLALIGYYQR